MKKVLIRSFATLVVFLCAVNIGFADNDGWTEKVVAEKSFDVVNGATLKVDHSYGSVSCANWDKNVISVVATVSVKTKNPEKAAKILDKINIEISGNSSEVNIDCIINNRGSLKKIKVDIDLDIKMPANVNLELDHSFGNVWIEKIDGIADINSDYGTVEIKALTNSKSSVELNFGKMNIDEFTNGDIEVSYGTCSVRNAENLSVESDYSDLIIGKVNKLSLENSGGDINVGYVENLKLESDFSNVEIDYLAGVLNAETSYGHLIINEVSAEFDNIEIDNSFSGIDIRIPDEVTYSMDVSCEYCDFAFPENNANVSYRKSGNGNTVIKAVVGKGDAVGNVSISGSYGSVKLY